MQWIFYFILRQRTAFSLIVTVVLSLAMISGKEAQQARIAQGLALSVFYPFQFVFSQISQMRLAFAENKRLKESVTALSTEVSLLREASRENQRLDAIIQFKEEFSYTLIPARVVAREPALYYKSIVLNTGSDNQIVPYMPVITRDGVVGKVIRVLPHSCLVQTLTDPSNRISVMVQRSRVVSIFETENSTDFFVRCRLHADVVVGDTMITSGLGGIYPRGLRMGLVSRINDRYDPIFKKVYIKAMVNFDRLEEACVVRLSPQWAAFKNELDTLGYTQ